MRRNARRRAAQIALLGATAVLLAGCGAPATVTPTKNPLPALPGLGRDIQAAHGVAKELQAEQNALNGASQ
jgi:predicted small secreted protein